MTTIALLASSKISSQSIMRCYDWATEISRQEVIVSSGFSSQLERDVLHFLLKGTCRIQMVLARAPYKKLPKEYEAYIESGRMEVISVCNTPRQTRDSALIRNRYIANEADVVVFVSLHKESSLYAIYEELLPKNKKIEIL